MAVVTKQVARLIKKNKHGKIRKGVSLFHNSLNWCSFRTDEGITGFIDSHDDFRTYYNRLIGQGYELVGELEIPPTIVNRLASTEKTDEPTNN